MSLVFFVYSFGTQGVSNVFAQHKPLLQGILEQLCRGKLSDLDYPCLSGVPSPSPYGAFFSLKLYRFKSVKGVLVRERK